MNKLPVLIPNEEYKDRVRRLQQAMAVEDLDAVLAMRTPACTKMSDISAIIGQCLKRAAYWSPEREIQKF